MNKAMMGSSIVVALVFAGCALEDDAQPGDELTGEVSQKLSSFGIWSWGCGGTTPCSLDLGVTTNRTCFLAGITGNLQGTSYTQVGVLKSGGHWGLQVIPQGHPLMGTAVCIPTAANQTTTGWHSGQAELSLGSTATRRCFLSFVENRTGFTAQTDYVRVRQVGATWYLGGNMPGKDTYAYATCVDVPNVSGGYGLGINGGSYLNQPVLDNNPFAWACGLSQIGGIFTYNSYSDGAWLDYNSGISEWEANVVNYKSLGAYCVK